MSYPATITSYETQINPTQITAPPLTTTFTPPYRCRTPFVYDVDCDEFACHAWYPPLLFIPFRLTVSASIQCLPQITIFDDGFVDGVYKYDPGLFCPDGMTTATSIGSTFLCCPSGLTYSSYGYGNSYGESCYATITRGEALVGLWGETYRVIVYSTTTFSGNMTLSVSASPVYLIHESNAIAPTPSNPSTPYTRSMTYPVQPSSPGSASSVVVTTSGGTICRRHNCQASPSATQGTGSDRPRTSSHIGLKVGASIGGVIAVAVIVLGYFLLTRYRRKRRLNDRERLNSVPADPEVEVVRKPYEKKRLPKLPEPEPRAELEGTPVETRGDGIYVWKPELEGTAGVPGAVGVYVKKKSELEAIHNGVTSSALAIRARATLTTVTPYESPIIGPSFTRSPPKSGVV